MIRRLAVTAAGLALFFLGARVPLPLLDTGALAELSRASGSSGTISIFALGTLALVLGEACLVFAPRVMPLIAPGVLTLTILLPLAAIVLDMIDTARLAARVPQLESILNLDNVHLAELLRAKRGGVSRPWWTSAPPAWPRSACRTT